MVYPAPLGMGHAAVIGRPHASLKTSPERLGALCAQEPIHIPGSIQPHGAVLVALADGRRVTHASANLANILGHLPEQSFGRTLDEVFGVAVGRELLEAGSCNGTSLGRVRSYPGPDGVALHLHAYSSGRYVCVDLEPVRDEAGQELSLTTARSVLDMFKQAGSRSELCALAVQGLKAITGYDRVMAYRFGENGDGDVIAEAREAWLEPYLGHRYPAADIPPQARQLFLRQRVGGIADSSYCPVSLLANPALNDAPSPDLTQSALRSVSPVHRQYMRNMNTAASLTIGLAHGNDLWGMLVCHNAKPRIAGPELRAVVDMIGQVVSLLLVSLGEAEIYAQRLERSATLRGLVERLAGSSTLAEALAAAEPELLRLVDAAGAVIRLSGTVLCVGQTPAPAMAERAMAILQSAAGGEILAVDDLGLRHPELAGCGREGSGALLLPLKQATDDAILWLRPELSRTVLWGGNPDEHMTWSPVSGEISPRRSFATWKQTVSGRSAPWLEAEIIVAGELRSAIEAEMAQRGRAELARLRHYDPLTGLPNRSLLHERLAEAGHDNPGAALLFLDLDRFKAVNDTMGHAAGDALLVEVAQRLSRFAGPETLVARLGGDEFVVLCRGLHRSAALKLAEAVRRAIETPFEILGRTCHVSASIGIATRDQSNGLDLVQAADMAMYAAKQCGGNRGLVFEPSLYDRAARQFELDRDLREALRDGDQFVLLYQPLFAGTSADGGLVGFEALVRWRHPRQGWIAPEVFLPFAEKSDLILPLGNWIIATALREGRTLQQASPDRSLHLAVNVSVAQLTQAGFCSGLRDALLAEGFSPEALRLEVTESMLTDVAVAYVLSEVRGMGVRIAIDDFGIGYSSLSYLRRFPADVVKLDRSFLEDGEPSGRAFVGAVVGLIHAAEMTVVVEGLETHAHLDTARAAGADEVQGFLFAQPLSAKAASLLAARPISKTLVAEVESAVEPMLVFQPVWLRTESGDDKGQLVLAAGRLVAVLVQLADISHEKLLGSWFLEAGFGRCDVANPPISQSLTAAQEWIAHRLEPAARARQAVGHATSTTQYASGANGRVLLVDDVQAVLDITGRFLKKAGIEVVQTLSPADALQAVAGRGPFDCLITDQSIPVMNGDELVKAARALSPGLPAVIITGGVTDEQSSERRDGILRLYKPFTQQELLHTVTHLIASGGAVSAELAAQSQTTAEITAI